MPEASPTTWPSPATACAGSPMSGKAWCRTSTRSWKLDSIKGPHFKKRMLIADYFKLLLHNKNYFLSLSKVSAHQPWIYVQIRHRPGWRQPNSDSSDAWHGAQGSFQLQLWLNVAQSRKFGEIRRITPFSQKNDWVRINSVTFWSSYGFRTQEWGKKECNSSTILRNSSTILRNSSAISKSGSFSEFRTEKT